MVNNRLRIDNKSVTGMLQACNQPLFHMLMYCIHRAGCTRSGSGWRYRR